MALIIKPLMQIILYVKDMGSEVHFYHDVLGLPIRYPAGLADYASQMWVELETGDCTLALHGGEHVKPDTKHEIVFEVEDVETARQAIVAAGIEMSPTRILKMARRLQKALTLPAHRFAIRTSA